MPAQISKTKIVNAALELFASKGYHATSINAIARKAGVAKGLIYHYFDSKEALLLEIVETVVDQVVGLRSLFESIQDPYLQLKQMLKFTFSLPHKNPDFWKFYTTLMFQADLPKSVKLLAQSAVQINKEILTAIFKKMNFSEPNVEAALFKSLMDGCLMNALFHHDLFPVEKMQEELLQSYFQHRQTEGTSKNITYGQNI